MSQIDRIRRLEAVHADANEQIQNTKAQIRRLERELKRIQYRLTRWEGVRRATDDALVGEMIRTDPVQFDVYAAKREIAEQFGPMSA